MNRLVSYLLFYLIPSLLICKGLSFIDKMQIGISIDFIFFHLFLYFHGLSQKNFFLHYFNNLLLFWILFQLFYQRVVY